MAGLIYEYVQFDEDPTFDSDDLVLALEADNWLYVSRRVGGGVVRESVLNRFEEGTQVDLEELIRMIEAIDSSSHVRVLAQANSLSEYEYLTRKLDQEIWDNRKLVDYSGVLGILVAIAVVLSDPIVFFVTGVLVIFAFRRGLFSTRRAALWGAGIGALGCASIVSVHEVLLHITQDFRTLDYSMGSVLIAALLGGLGLSLVGAYTSGRSYKSVAKIQDASIRVAVVCGLSAPILQWMVSRLGLTENLDSPAILNLAFFTFVVVAIYYIFLDSIRFFMNRKNWIIWLITLGELQAHSVYTVSNLQYLIVVFATPLVWIPSAFGLEILYRRFDNMDIPIILKTIFQVVMLLMVGYLTWIILGDMFGIMPSNETWR